jgi:hypothetical protein
MKCKTCLLTDDIVTIHTDGECEFCKLHQKIVREYKPQDFNAVLKKIRKVKGKYNCLIGISGGFDSSIMLHKAVKIWGLNPLVIHFDNHYNTPEADYNIMQLVKHLGVDFVRYFVNKHEFDEINRAFLLAGTPDCDIPYDMVYTAFLFKAARQYKIKYILNGNNPKTEGSQPLKYSYMDAKYIQDVYNKFYGKKVTLPIFTFKDQLYYAWKGHIQIRPFYYINIDFESEKNRLIKNYGLKDYGYKHGENIYTDFVGAYLLPGKFQIDKRIVYLSARIRSGVITKKQATEILNTKRELPQPVLMLAEKFSKEIKSPVRDRSEYARYNFKKYRILMWLLLKLKVIPLTFYKKYCT